MTLEGRARYLKCFPVQKISLQRFFYNSTMGFKNIYIWVDRCDWKEDMHQHYLCSHLEDGYKIRTRVSVERRLVSSSYLSWPWTQKRFASTEGCLACSVVPVLSRDLRYSSACWDPTSPACRDVQSLWFCTFKLNQVQRSTKTALKYLANFLKHWRQDTKGKKKIKNQPTNYHLYPSKKRQIIINYQTPCKHLTKKKKTKLKIGQDPSVTHFHPI